MLLKNENNIIRILQKKEDKFLVIDCVKRTMPKWVEKTFLSDYIDCCDAEMYECTDYPAGRTLTQEEQRIAQERFTMIAGVLPFIGNEQRRSQMIKARDAVRFYDLPTNPAAKAGNMGKEKTREMLYWTKDEYIKFSEEIMDKPVSFYAFEMLYWCGLRLGEMLALTPADFNFEKGIVRINKSYQRIGSEDVITDPKTEKSNRNVQMPSFLMDEIKEYLDSLYGIEDNQRMFPVTKSYMHNEMSRGSIRIITEWLLSAIKSVLDD